MKKTTLFVLPVFIIFSCTNKPEGPDVSNIKVNITFQRFEKDFFELDTNRLSSGLNKFQARYPNFYPDFMQQILGVSGDDTDSATLKTTKEFYQTYISFNDSLLKKYKSTSAIEKEIKNGLQHVKYYFPSYKTPNNIISFLGPLDAPGVATGNNYIGIGLQLFAGKNFSAYKEEYVQQIFPLYISRRFDEEYIASNCIKAIIEELFPDQSKGKPLIEQMIEKGKQWYLLDLLLPDSPDSVKTGYTKAQLDWCNKNEGEIWSIIKKNEDLNTINPTVIQTYIGEGPFTQGFSQENSPGNLGQWIGWQIVKKYAEKNPSQKPEDIMQTNARKILDEAKYKPK